MPSHGAMKDMVRKKAKKEFSHMELKPAENGGAIATHHFTSYEHQPEAHVFGKGDGKKMAAHVMEHMGMSVKSEPEDKDLEIAKGDDDHEAIEA